MFYKIIHPVTYFLDEDEKIKNRTPDGRSLKVLNLFPILQFKSMDTPFEIYWINVVNFNSELVGKN